MRFVSLLCLCLWVAVFGNMAQLSAQDTQRPSQRLTFLDEVYYLGFSGADEAGVLNEYFFHDPAIPSDRRTLENWSKALIIRSYYNSIDAGQLAREQETTVKQAFPDSNVALQVVEGGKDARLRFLVHNNDTPRFHEFNMWRYRKVDNPRDMVISYRFAFRVYSEDRANLIHQLKPVMNSWSQAFFNSSWSYPSFYVDEEAVKALEKEGLTSLQSGDYNGGIQALVQVVNAAPQDPDRHLNLGSILFTYARVLIQSGQEETARGVFESADGLLRKSAGLYATFSPEDPGHAQAWFLVGEIAFHVMEDAQEAIISYQKAIRADGKHAGAKQALAAFQEVRQGR